MGFGLICSACGGSSTTTGSNTTVCDAGTARCNGDDIERCDETGAAETIERTCPEGRCQVNGSQAFCAATPITTSCAADEAVCDGNTATTCKVDGSGPRPGGVNCADTKQQCIAGKCHDTKCIGGAKSCQDGNVYECVPDGSSLFVSAYCKDSEVCDDDLDVCLPRVCKPDAGTCNLGRVQTCNAFGSDWLPGSTDCMAQGKVCVDGSCQEQACPPFNTFCQDGNVYLCSPKGDSSSLSQTCITGSEHCEVSPAGLYAFCVTNKCTPGTTLCDGDVIKSCNDDGSLPEDGTACGTDEFCENATCKPRLCDLNTLLCKGKDIYFCDVTGPTLHKQCDADQACLAIAHSTDTFYPDQVQCMPLPCPPGATGCALNEIGTCGPDGQSLSTVTTDCTANANVCTTSATCAASATDTLGLDETVEALAAGTYAGNVIDVRSPRKLTELQLWSVFASPRDLHWVVYEQVGNDFVLRVDKTTSQASSSGFVSSGPLSFSYKLEAGKRYALGVSLSGDGVCFDQTMPFTGNASFGSLLGSVRTFADSASFDIASNFVPGVVGYMNVTTASP
ncbi:MAG: hypothetical protein WDO69_27685 [Pseudomonadota bacterium]